MIVAQTQVSNDATVENRGGFWRLSLRIKGFVYKIESNEAQKTKGVQKETA